jgi:hypothetical protein
MERDLVTWYDSGGRLLFWLDLRFVLVVVPVAMSWLFPPHVWDENRKRHIGALTAVKPAKILVCWIYFPDRGQYADGLVRLWGFWAIIEINQAAATHTHMVFEEKQFYDSYQG